MTSEDFLFRDILCAPAMGAKRDLTENPGNRGRIGVPRWRLNDRMPLFGSWAKVVLSDIRRTVQRITLLRRAGWVSR